MRTKYIYHLILCTLLPTFFSCQEELAEKAAGSTGSVKVRLATRNMTGNGTTDAAITSVSAYRFEAGELQEILDGLKTDASGILHLTPSQMRGSVYFLANAQKALEGTDFQEGQTSLETFLQAQASARAMQAEGVLMTGSLELEATMPPTADALLQRSMARIDVECLLDGVEVSRITVKDLSATGYIHPQTLPSVPEGAPVANLDTTFATALSNATAPLFYVCEQKQDATHAVEVLATVNGGWQKLKTTLKDIRRNHIYTLKIYGNGAGLQLKVEADGWENGSSSDADISRMGLVDTENSQFSKGVRVNEGCDSVFIPYLGSDFQLALKGEENASVVVNGQADGVLIQSSGKTKTLQTVSNFSVKSKRKMPGSTNEYIYLDIYRQNVHTGRVVLKFEANPLLLTGKLKFDDNALCDFQTYADGELGILTLPEGKSIQIEFDKDTPHWIRLDPAGTNAYSIQGGWKPNDPEADGRVQEARMVITDLSNNQKEIYTIRRQNWGLPVVQINGIWWCKYNLRGNVKNFQEQVLVKDDKIENMATYMKTCTDDELLALLGDQYLGGKPEGLKLAYDTENSRFHYAGYDKNGAKDFGYLPATEMAPAGYEVPSYETWQTFTANNNMRMNYGEGQYFNNTSGQKIWYTIHARNVNWLGHDYGPIIFYEYYSDAEQKRIVLSGLGCVTSSNTIYPGDASNNTSTRLLLGTIGRNRNTWLIEGWTQASGKGCWYKEATHDAATTRTLRCIKSPVDYIME